MELTRAIAENVVGVQYSDLPPFVVEVTKKSILDGLGVTLAANTLGESCRQVVELSQESGGKGESTILGYGSKVSSYMAAFANGAMIHALDYEDTLDATALHPTGATLPAALAIAEKAGKIDGRKFITAIAMGNDLVARMGLAETEKAAGWCRPIIFGVFGATAAAAKLLGLGTKEMVGALGMALNQASGSMEGSYGTGSSFRGIRDAFTGKAGVFSALLAQKGLSAAEAVFEGERGFFNLYFRGKYNSEALTKNLGRRFEGAYVSFKPWPSCRATHAAIEATLKLVREHRINPDDVKEIKLITGTTARSRVLPLESRQKPGTSVDAMFSMPYCASAAFLRGKISFDDFSPEAIRDSRVLQLARKTSYEFRTEFDRMWIEPTMVEVSCHDGKTYSHYIDRAYGHPSNPISEADLAAKFRDCASHAIRPPDKKIVDSIIEMVTNLETVPDVKDLIKLMG